MAVVIVFVIVMMLVFCLVLAAVQFGNNIGSVALKAKLNGFELKVSRVRQAAVPAIEPPTEDPGS